MAETVEIREPAFASVDPEDWDRFVLAADGSFQGSWKVVRAHRLFRHVRVFEFFAASPPGPDCKVGQCAVAITRGGVRFLDRLHVARTHDHLWDRCFRLVVERCGEATYHYGSPWNHESRRACALSGPLAAARVGGEPFQIDVVDFGRWADFSAYRRSVSENLRRDYRKAAATSARVVTRHGLAALRDLVGFARLRRHVMRKNHERFSCLADCGRHALKLLCLGRGAFIATVRTRARCHVAFFGVRFGHSVYYLSGGTDDNVHGFGSYLFLTLLERWFTDHPDGKLYLGVQPAWANPRTYTGGNLLYRRKLRASSVSGAEFHLTVTRRSR